MGEAQSIGWIGLGKLGLPMAGRLAGSGRAVSGFDRNEARRALAQARGIEAVATLTEAVEPRDVVFTSLPDDAALVSVMLGEDGLLARMRRGAILGETSTVSPTASARVAEAADAAGIRYLRLPISGSSALAEQGLITCFASGPRQAFEALKPVLARFTRAQKWLGEDEQARYAKLAVNLMIAVSAGMMAEAVALARKGGIGWSDILGVMAESAVASPFVKYKVGPLEKRDFSATFTTRQLIKDLELILDAAGSAGVPVPLLANLRQSYAAVLTAGGGDDDFITIVRHVERLAGLDEPL